MAFPTTSAFQLELNQRVPSPPMMSVGGSIAPPQQQQPRHQDNATTAAATASVSKLLSSLYLQQQQQQQQQQLKRASSPSEAILTSLLNQQGSAMPILAATAGGNPSSSAASSNNDCAAFNMSHRPQQRSTPSPLPLLMAIEKLKNETQQAADALKLALLASTVTAASPPSPTPVDTNLQGIIAELRLNKAVQTLKAQQQQQQQQQQQRLSPSVSMIKQAKLQKMLELSARSTGKTMLATSSLSSFSSSTAGTSKVSNSSCLPIKEVPSERKSLGLTQDCKTPEEVKRTLRILGTTLRSKADPFIDAAKFQDPGSPRCSRGGICELFPHKVERMLRELEESGEDDIISFLPHGRAFMVHKMDKFLKVILPRYFTDQTKWSSFSRQLNLYGFLRVNSGKDTGAYYSELFLRSHPNLCNYMRRVGAPHGLDRRRHKLPEGDDPNFYSMPPVTTTATVSTTAPEQEQEDATMSS